MECTLIGHVPQTVQREHSPKAEAKSVSHSIPYVSKSANNEYLAQTILRIPYVETQSPSYIGIWTLKKNDLVSPEGLFGT